ncbi:MAG TPA: hypothetical protein VGH53_07950 [Streptosporangiaceae bacterium]
MLTESVLTEAPPFVPGVDGHVLPHSLLAVSLRAAPLAATADAAARLLLSLALPGELAGQSAAARALPLPNGTNAPADNPEDDTLPPRALRPDLPERPGESDAEADEAAAREPEPSDAGSASALEGASRGTPGMSQPRSVIARLPLLSAGISNLVFRT